jgi:hypothetical protein
MMENPFKRRDLAFMLSGVIVALVFAVVGIPYNWPLVVDIVSLRIIIVPAILSLYFVYRGIDSIGGEVSEALKHIGVGLAAETALFVPLVNWHLRGMESLYGFSSGSAFILLHGFAFVGFIAITEGFKNLKEAEKESERTLSDSEEDDYREYVEIAVSAEETSIGESIARAQARQVEGLELDEEGNFDEISGSAKEVFEELLDNYESISGDVARKIIIRKIEDETGDEVTGQ